MSLFFGGTVRMRIAVVAAILISQPAFARLAPGPMPYVCSIYQACEVGGSCISVHLPFSSLRIFEKDGDYFTVGVEPEYELPVGLFETVDAANTFLSGKKDNLPFGRLLVPFDGVADAAGFDFYAITYTAGKTAVSSSYLRLACHGRRG